MSLSLSRLRRYQARCMWCGGIFDCSRMDVSTCGPKCRQKLHRYRERTGFDPLIPPGDKTVQEALDDLIADLIARERLRRYRGGPA